MHTSRIPAEPARFDARPDLSFTRLKSNLVRVPRVIRPGDALRRTSPDIRGAATLALRFVAGKFHACLLLVGGLQVFIGGDGDD
jgi:hypothetical protein